MKVTGILKNKPRVLSKVIYLDVAESMADSAPKKQWIVFKDKHTYQDINTISNAVPGSSLIVDGKDNLNKMTGQQQVVVHSLVNIIPPDAPMPSYSSNTISNDFSIPDATENISIIWHDLNALMSQLPKQKAIGMLAKKISILNGETSNV